MKTVPSTQDFTEQIAYEHLRDEDSEALKESTITLDELLDIAQKTTNSNVGRLVVLALLGMKKEQSENIRAGY